MAAVRLLALTYVLVTSFFPSIAAASDAPPFSQVFVQGHRGVLTQGGLIVLRLQPETHVWLNGEAVDQLDNQALIGFGRDAELTQQLRFARMVDGRSQDETHTLMLKKRDYNIQRIEGLPRKMVTPPPEALALIRKQGAMKRAARATTSRETWFATAFTWPAKGRISGVYGSQRVYNGQPGRPHFGIDIAAPRTTPVYAPAPGRVTLAETDMYFEGGLIFLDHGLSLTSVFMHLDSLDVAPGDIVQQGDLIGRIGSTGRSTGPHLDWRMYWQNQRVDPALLVPPMPPMPPKG